MPIGNPSLFLTDHGIFPWYLDGMNEYKEGTTYSDWFTSTTNTQSCYKEFVDKLFCTDSIEKEHNTLSYTRETPTNSSNLYNIDNHIKLLFRSEHLDYVRRMREMIYPEDSLEGESTRVLMIYWSLHSEELLDNYYYDGNSRFADTDEEAECDTNIYPFYKDSDEILDTILSFQDINGGFGGNFSHIPNMVSTYLAISSLIMVGDLDALLKIDRFKMYNYFLKLRDVETGGFRIQLDGEIDVRAFYCISAVANMLYIVTDELFENIENYLLKCVGFDGGYSGDFYGESHGGYTYCAVAGLCILGKTDSIDIDSLLYWAVQRQSGIEGGFQGRTNKLVDSCYSFWFTGIFFCIMEILRTRKSNKKSEPNMSFYDPFSLQSFILICSQLSEGGFIDKPGKKRDLYHTCYALSGLSLAQRMSKTSECSCNEGITSSIYSEYEMGEFIENCNKYSPFYSIKISKDDIINPTDPFLNIRPDKIYRSRKLFGNIPIILTSDGKVGTEGIGYKKYIESTNLA
ncbi:chain B [Cryptosporidium bovis]|uniref:chain B n=1 Tax=Cryptosporidium bovis TaxID=310047 RepID=UPI00351A8AB2|nr:chain B [Cryptosporidium bovis]